ncbi:MAG: twin-arginine translocase TatA/TatE family subunit [Dehalococcoidia bacterium]
MGRLGPPELIIILVIVLLLFGATRLPKLMRSMGEGVKEFRKGVSSLEEGEKKGRGKTRSKTKKA